MGSCERGEGDRAGEGVGRSFSNLALKMVHSGGQHILHIIPIGGSTQRTQKDCVSGAKVVDDASR